MIEGMQTLEAAGADYVAIPCITAHHWYEELCWATKMPILHIAEPPALDGMDAALAARCVDSLDALARACVFLGLKGSPPESAIK